IPQGDKGVRVFAEPALPGLEIVNQLKLGDGSCPDGNRAFRELIQASFQSQPPRASFAGTYPLSCGERDLNIALHDPQDYVAAMIRQLWGEMGGTWSGSVRDGVVPPGARLLYVHESEPLGDIVRDINKFSNNVMARQLFLTLGAERGGPPARAEEAARAIAGYVLDRNGRRHVVVMIANHPKAPEADAAMDALLQWVYDSPTAPARPITNRPGASPPRP